MSGARPSRRSPRSRGGERTFATSASAPASACHTPTRIRTRIPNPNPRPRGAGSRALTWSRHLRASIVLVLRPSRRPGIALSVRGRRGAGRAALSFRSGGARTGGVRAARAWRRSGRCHAAADRRCSPTQHRSSERSAATGRGDGDDDDLTTPGEQAAAALVAIGTRVFTPYSRRFAARHGLRGATPRGRLARWTTAAPSPLSSRR